MNNKDILTSETKNEKEAVSFASSIYEGLSVVISAIFIIALVFTFGFRLVGVSGSSMVDTLHDGEWLIVTPYYNEPVYGDIVISSHRLETMGPIVKRVIATEGDKVYIDTDGVVFVNDKQLNETYTVPAFMRKGDLSYPVTIPEGHVMLMGDNRPASSDSRYSYVGFAPVDALLGKAQIRLSGQWDIYSNFSE
ncbi:MAG: signal peptidase I [Clostridia bacterium]|nr:signal peptidase I [Oscillospiraceae bacterium]MBR2410177.1 signal peptidase I [Clostridia bacterium]